MWQNPVKTKLIGDGSVWNDVGTLGRWRASTCRRRLGERNKSELRETDLSWEREIGRFQQGRATTTPLVSWTERRGTQRTSIWGEWLAGGDGRATGLEASIGAGEWLKGRVTQWLDEIDEQMKGVACLGLCAVDGLDGSKVAPPL